MHVDNFVSIRFASSLVYVTGGLVSEVESGMAYEGGLAADKWAGGQTGD